MCVSLMPSEVDPIFICLLAIWTSSFRKCLFTSLEVEEQGLHFTVESPLRQPGRVTGNIEADSLETLTPMASHLGTKLQLLPLEMLTASLRGQNCYQRLKDEVLLLRGGNDLPKVSSLELSVEPQHGVRSPGFTSSSISGRSRKPGKE